MKPGDLVRIISTPRPTRDFHPWDPLGGKLGLIVVLETMINDKPMWSVMVDGELFPIREQHLEPVDETR